MKLIYGFVRLRIRLSGALEKAMFGCWPPPKPSPLQLYRCDALLGRFFVKMRRRQCDEGEGFRKHRRGGSGKSYVWVRLLRRTQT